MNQESHDESPRTPQTKQFASIIRPLTYTHWHPGSSQRLTNASHLQTMIVPRSNVASKPVRYFWQRSCFFDRIGCIKGGCLECKSG